MADENVEHLAPIIIDLGKKNRKQVRKLRRGKPGRLMDKIKEVLVQSYQAEAIPAGAQPVVVVVREKSRRRASKAIGHTHTPVGRFFDASRLVGLRTGGDGPGPSSPLKKCSAGESANGFVRSRSRIEAYPGQIR